MIDFISRQLRHPRSCGSTSISQLFVKAMEPAEVYFALSTTGGHTSCKPEENGSSTAEQVTAGGG